MEEKLLQQILEELQKGNSSGGNNGQVKFDTKNIEALTVALKKQTDELTKSQPKISQFRDLMAGVKQPILDVQSQLDDFDQQIEEATKATKAGAKGEIDATEVKRVAALQTAKADLAKQAASKNVKVALGNLAIGAADVAQSMADGAMSFVKGLQSNMSGVELGTQAAINSAKAFYKTGDAVGEFGNTVGVAVSLMGGPWVKAIGLAITALSALWSFFSKRSQQLAEDSLQLLGDELKKTEKSFSEINSAGAILAGGMTQMRSMAADAGLSVDKFSAVVKASSSDISDMGMGMTEGAKQVGKVSKELRNSDLGMQLRKLGYSAEEQAEMSAAVMAQMNAAGDTRVNNEKYVAEQTAKYGKDLKILADVTGVDAKKAADEARKQSMSAAIVGKLNERQRLAYEGVLRATPKEGQLALMQSVLSHGTAIADVGFNVAAQSNQQLGVSMKATTDKIWEGVDDVGEAQNFQLKENAKIGAAQLEANKKHGELVNAQAFGAHSDAIDGAAGLENAYTQIGIKVKKGAVETAEANADAMAKNMAPMDVAINKLEEETDRAKAALGDKLTPAITTAAEVMMRSAETVDQMLAKYGVVTGGGKSASTAESRAADNQKVMEGATSGKGFWGKVKSWMGAAGAGMANASDLGTTVGGTDVGATPPPAGTPVTGATTPPKVTLPTAGAPGSAGGPTGASQDDLAKAGFKMKAGDVQAAGAPLSSGLLSFAKKVQENFPGFSYFSSFDDMFHQKNAPDSKHAKGLAIDFALGKRPTEEEGKALVAQLKQMGASLAIDEYNHPSGKATGGHMHAEVSAEDGAMVSGPKSGYPATLHGNELITPLDKNTVFNEMLDKLDQMVKVLKDHKDISEKTFRATT